MPRLDSSAEIKSAPSGQLRGDKECPVWRNQVWQSLEGGAGKRCGECDKKVGVHKSRDLRREDSSVGRASDGKARSNTARCGFESPVQQGIFLPQSTVSADSPAVSAHPRVPSQASTPVYTFKIPSPGSRTIVRRQENTIHTLTGKHYTHTDRKTLYTH